MSTANMDKLKQLYERSKRKVFIWFPKKGRNRIRIMPPSPGTDDIFIEGATHFTGKAEDAGLCNNAFDFIEDECSHCLTHEAIQDEDPETAARLKARGKWFVNIIDLDNPEAGVRLGSLPVSVGRDILSFMLDPAWGDLTDLKTGRDITIDREGSGLNTEYTVRPDPSSRRVSVESIPPIRDAIAAIATGAAPKCAGILEPSPTLKDESQKENKKMTKEEILAKIRSAKK